MLKELIGKDVCMYVAFSNAHPNGGCVPAFLSGKILDVTDEFVKMEVLDSSLSSDARGMRITAETGNCIVKIQYIISVFEK